MFGLTAEEYSYITLNVVEPLEELGAKAWCFGSRARGDFHPFSDLDIMIEAPSVDISHKLGEIRETLSNSNFPYKVDIVLQSEFAESYKDGYLKDRQPFINNVYRQ